MREHKKCSSLDFASYHACVAMVDNIIIVTAFLINGWAIESISLLLSWFILPALLL